MPALGVFRGARVLGNEPNKTSIFGGGAQQSTQSPNQGQPYAMTAPLQAPKQSLLQRLQGLASIANVLIFAYIFIGEIFLPEPFKATTFLGKRLGGIHEAVTIVDSAKANVELRKTCEQTIRDQSIQVYNGCMRQPRASHPLCNIEAQLYRERYNCSEIAGDVQSQPQFDPSFENE